MGFSTGYTASSAAVLNSPFSLAASAQMPSATSLVGPALAYHNRPMAPIAPVPQALADPVLSCTYTLDSLDSAGGYSFGATRPQDMSLSGSNLLPASNEHGMALPMGLPVGLSANGPSTPTAASGPVRDSLVPYKHSPFPGVGTGVAGSLPFKFRGNLEQKFEGWSVPQQLFQ